MQMTNNKNAAKQKSSKWAEQKQHENYNNGNKLFLHLSFNFKICMHRFEFILFASVLVRFIPLCIYISLQNLISSSVI